MPQVLQPEGLKVVHDEDGNDGNGYDGGSCSNYKMNVFAPSRYPPEAHYMEIKCVNILNVLLNSKIFSLVIFND